MPPDPGKPLPEDVLRSLSHELEFKDKLRELCNEAGHSLTLIDERVTQSIRSSADEGNLVGDVLISHNGNDGEPSNCLKYQTKNISLGSQGTVSEEDDDAIPNEGSGICPQQLLIDQMHRSETNGTSGLKVTSMTFIFSFPIFIMLCS